VNLATKLICERSKLNVIRSWLNNEWTKDKVILVNEVSLITMKWTKDKVILVMSELDSEVHLERS